MLKWDPPRGAVTRRYKWKERLDRTEDLCDPEQSRHMSVYTDAERVGHGGRDNLPVD